MSGGGHHWLSSSELAVAARSGQPCHHSLLMGGAWRDENILSPAAFKMMTDRLGFLGYVHAIVKS